MSQKNSIMVRSTNRSLVLMGVLILLSSTTISNAFSIQRKIFHQSPISRTSLKASASSSPLSPGDAILLVGPGFLQLNIAKAAKAAGLRPVIVAPQKKIDSFAGFLRDDELIKDATIGIPDPGEPFYGEISSVVFCAEEAVLPSTIISTVLDWKDQGIYSNPDGPKRVLACTPISNKVSKDKSMGWMPIFNNDKGEKAAWEKFVQTYLDHPKFKGPGGSIIYFGSLLGGSVDGPPSLEALGLDEQIYKMSLENYRDLKERAFDRFRLGGQVLPGNSINLIPPNQEKMEKEAIKKGEHLEAFRAVGGYPEQDRTNRHTLAQAVVHSLLRPIRSESDATNSEKTVPKETTVLSKCVGELPSEDEWDNLFMNPEPASWPDPFTFDPAKYGFEMNTSN